MFFFLPSECQDGNKNCKYWASHGHCKKSANYMSKNCRKSCNLCQGIIATQWKLWNRVNKSLKFLIMFDQCNIWLWYDKWYNNYDLTSSSLNKLFVANILVRIITRGPTFPDTFVRTHILPPLLGSQCFFLQDDMEEHCMRRSGEVSLLILCGSAAYIINSKNRLRLVKGVVPTEGGKGQHLSEISLRHSMFL